ncbi:MAG: hypothetical protein Kow00108_02400 [Calditrichia bacterium]
MINISQTIEAEPLSEIFSRATENIFAGHGFYVTFAGMMAVFLGLLVLWIFINAFKKFATIQAQGFKKPKKSEPLVDKSLSPISMVGKSDLPRLAAIIAATCAYCEEFEEDHIETLKLRDIDQEISPWAVVAREQMLRK